MSEPQERGPNYDWKHEVNHYRDECEKLRELLRKVESSGDREIAALRVERDRLAEEVKRLHDKYDLQLLVRRSDRYREALEWYANAGPMDLPSDCQYEETEYGTIFKPGKRARTALEDKDE